jgi:hypothetical protein
VHHIRHPDLDWSWLVAQAKLDDLQNRLGFVVTLIAERQANPAAEAAQWNLLSNTGVEDLTSV